MVPLVLLAPTARRESLVLLDLLELLVPVVLLETGERLDLLVLLASLGLLVQMVSLVSRENKERVGRREMLVPPDPRDLLVPQDLRDLLEYLGLKVLAVLRDLLVPLVSQELLAEWDLLVPMVTQVPLDPLGLQVKMAPRASEAMAVPQADRETLDCVDLPAPPERKEILERMVPLVQMAPQAPLVWPDSVVSLVFLGSAEREASPVFQDPLVSLESRELLVAVETVDPLDPLDLQG